MENLEIKEVSDRERALQKKIEQLEKIQKALMGRVERSTESQSGAFSLFEGNILLSSQLKKRTEELKHLNDELGERTNQLQLIIRALPGTIILFSADFQIVQSFRGSGDEIPLQANEPLNQAFNADFKVKLVSSLESQIASKHPVAFDFLYMDQDKLRSFNATLSSITQGFFVIYIWDSTEDFKQKQMIEDQKAQILQASKLSSLGEMAGSIAHEINNPLAIISAVGFRLVGLLAKDPMDRPKIQENIVKIQSTVERISKIVKSMRQVSRDASTDQFEPCSLNLLVDELLDVCREKFSSHGIKFGIDLPGAQQVRCRKIQISQVILNLLNNAYHIAKNTPDGWVRISSTDLGEKIRIHVVDPGHGISPAIQTKLFQPFFSTKEVGEGTGLGLSISRKIVQEHGSDLQYELKDGWTSFFFDLEKVRSK